MERARWLPGADRVDARRNGDRRRVEARHGVAGTRDDHLITFHHLEVGTLVGSTVDLDAVHPGRVEGGPERVVGGRGDVAPDRGDLFTDRSAVEVDDLGAEFVGPVGDELRGVGEAERQPDLAGHEHVGRVALHDRVRGAVAVRVADRVAVTVAATAPARSGDARRSGAEQEGAAVEAEPGGGR